MLMAIEVTMVTDKSNYKSILQRHNELNHYQRNTFVKHHHNSKNNTGDIIFLKTLRSKSLTTTTIYEEKDESRETFSILKLQRMDDILVNDIDSSKQYRKKQVYKSRKHYSDYDIVYLQVEDDGLDETDSNDSMSTDSCDGGARSKLEYKHFTSEEKFRKAKSESNLSIPPSRPLSAGHSRTSSHIDITETKTYKEIYADNLRQYSFLLAKQLGTNLSQDALRKSYLKSRQRAMERRERANTASEPTSRRSSTQETPSRKTSSASKTSHGSMESLKSEKHTTSLTDISTLVNEKDLKRPTTVNRRKHKKTIDPTKRLSAPLLNSQVIFDIENDIKLQQQNISLSRSQEERISLTSLSVPDLSQSDTSEDHEERERKLSTETLQRQKQAKQRLEWRMSRLTSFEGVLSQAGDLIKNYKRKASKHSQNNSENNSKNNSSTDLSNLSDVSATVDDNNNTNKNNEGDIITDNSETCSIDDNNDTSVVSHNKE